MNNLKIFIVLLALIYHTNSDKPCKKVCVLDNVKCVTKGGFNVYKTVVNGVKGLNKPLDPLHFEKIEGVMENVKYKFTNITMNGLKKCTVTKLLLNVTINEYQQFLHCPKLVSHYNFEAQQNTDNPVLRGNVTAIVNAYDYHIVNYGLYSVFVNEDHRPHFFILTQNSRTNLKGKLEYAITKGQVTDTNQVSRTFKNMNNSWWQTENVLHEPMVKRAMTILINKTDLYIRENTMGETLPFD